MAPITDMKQLPFVAADPSYYLDAWYEVDDLRRDMTLSEELAFGAFCRWAFEKLVSEAEELAGWIPRDLDPAGELVAVRIDRVNGRVVYVRKDGSRETKTLAAFVDDPFVMPADTRREPPRNPHPRTIRHPALLT